MHTAVLTLIKYGTISAEIAPSNRETEIMNSNPNNNHEQNTHNDRLGAGIALGVGVGLAIGTAIGSVGAGLAIGLAIGAGTIIGMRRTNNQVPNEE